MQFFKRYNYIVFITLTFFLSIAIGLFYLQYKSQYQHKLSEIKSSFESRINYLEMLRVAKDHVEGMKIKAETYFSTHPQVSHSPLFFQLQQSSSDEYHLDEIKPPYSNKITANLTGIGSLQNRDQDFYRELEMAFELNPLFQMASYNVPSMTWAYYISSNHFVNFYPWAPSSEVKFTNDFLSYEVYYLGSPQNNPHRQIYWTNAYLDAAGKGLMVSVASPIYESNKFLGIVGIDFTLDTLNQFVRNFYFEPAQLFITNKDKQLLAHTTLVSSKDKEILTLEQAFPEIPRSQLEQIYQQPEREFIKLDNYLIMYGNLSYIPWQLFILIPKQPIIYEVVREIGGGFFLLLPSLLIILIITNYLIRHDFVYPAQRLIEHIEQENKGFATTIPRVPTNWKPWFETVSYIFSENRRLFEELKQHLFSLEEKVKERTRDIELKNQSLLLLNQEKNEFLGIVAHDLKNPLSGIRGLAEIIKDDAHLLSHEEITKYNQMIFDESERMFQLITNLLDVNAIESGKINVCLEEINFAVIINKLVQNYNQRAQEKQISIISDFNTETELLIKSDYSLMEQVLDNLLSNAIKYSPLGKNVFIRIISTERYINCEIEDQGQGLSEKDQQKLFGKFSRLTAKPTAGEHSTGLGLFIVKKLVTALKGEIYCKSILGQGSTFGVTFEIVDSK